MMMKIAAANINEQLHARQFMHFTCVHKVLLFQPFMGHCIEVHQLTYSPLSQSGSEAESQLSSLYHNTILSFYAHFHNLKYHRISHLITQTDPSHIHFRRSFIPRLLKVLNEGRPTFQALLANDYSLETSIQSTLLRAFRLEWPKITFLLTAKQFLTLFSPPPCPLFRA